MPDCLSDGTVSLLVAVTELTSLRSGPIGEGCW